MTGSWPGTISRGRRRCGPASSAAASSRSTASCRRPCSAARSPPTHRFFRRNHFPIPELDPEAWRLSVAGLVRETLSVSLRDLREMPAQSITATLECAGNGRALFSPAPGGERWELGAVSTAHWTGARLRDVLDRAGVLPSARELIFRGADGGPLADLPEPIRFERSLGVEDAMRSGALLAYEMNGDPLPVRHGFPVRLVVPGWYAVASVKWLTEVEATDRPFRGFFQDSHYVYEWQRDGQTEREPVRRQRVRAMIVEPPDGSRIPSGDVTVSGVAWSGEAPVRRRRRERRQRIGNLAAALAASAAGRTAGPVCLAALGAEPARPARRAGVRAGARERRGRQRSAGHAGVESAGLRRQLRARGRGDGRLTRLRLGGRPSGDSRA